jgi:hypothetical protein
MGLNASFDEFCDLMDEVLAGITSVVKVIHNIFIQAESYEEVEEQPKVVLERCSAAGITLTKGKLMVGIRT